MVREEETLNSRFNLMGSASKALQVRVPQRKKLVAIRTA
jgi:hypothetical protein